MAMTLNVPSMKCEGCAETITKEIKTLDANATVNIDLEKKTVEVASGISEASVKQAITTAGHQIA